MTLTTHTPPYVAIIDYSLGNLTSIKQALTASGITAWVTDNPSIIQDANAIILPGVGAFQKAMEELEQRNLLNVLTDYVSSGRPLIGICLGMQLLFSSSEEFGCHHGLGLIPGHVSPFPRPLQNKKSHGQPANKVPQIGWNTISPAAGAGARSWEGTLLEHLPEKAYMYFMHSFYVTPEQEEVVLSITEYGGVCYCSSVACGNVLGFQFHPERSGAHGLAIYKNLAKSITHSSHIPSISRSHQHKVT